MYEWDPAKARANLAKHGVPFDAVQNFGWDAALEVDDRRFDYGERRVAAIGPIGARLHVLIYTLRRSKVRVISLRRATLKERKAYAKQKAQGR